MSAQRERPTPVVPLEAGAGPDNPPCPACGEPLFGWIDARPGLGGPVKRCESCGLSVIGEAGGVEEALAALDLLTDDGAVRIVNRAGLAAWIGGTGWSGIAPQCRYLFTPEAVSRLVANRDQVVVRSRWRPGAGIATMWQTVLNGVTFGRNVALAALGKGAAAPAERAWQRRLDAVVSVIAAIPAIVVSAPLELIAGLARRGSAVTLKLELL